MRALVVGNGITSKDLMTYFNENSIEYYLISNDIDYDLNSIPMCDVTYMSYGIRPVDKEYEVGRLLSTRISSELELALNLLDPNKVILVTGSNGKTTTASMLAFLLRKGGKRVLLAGNIGLPLIKAYKYFDRFDYYVIEVSSFQLELINDIRPLKYGIITSLSPNHLNKYHSYDSYLLSKKRISLLTSTLFTTYDVSRKLQVNSHVVPFDDDSCPLLEGRHNKENYLLAKEVLKSENISVDDNVIKGFMFPRFRQEIVYKSEKLLIINDSKSTSASATLMALKRFDNGLRIVILNGKIKSDIEVLKDVSNVTYIAYGDTRFEFCQILGCQVCESLTDTYKLALALSSPSDFSTIIFSPGGSTLNGSNYVERGLQFNEVIKKYGTHQE